MDRRFRVTRTQSYGPFRTGEIVTEQDLTSGAYIVVEDSAGGLWIRDYAGVMRQQLALV